MLCEKCSKNTASVYMKQNINGSLSESRLCSACAEELYGQNGAPLINLFKSDMETNFFNLLNFGKITPPSYSFAERKICPMCGLSFSEITKSGKAGCGECYETFKDEFTPNVKRIHGTATHTGRIPKTKSAKISAKRKIEELKTRLARMIEEQNFEQAAQIRDEINKITNENRQEA